MHHFLDARQYWYTPSDAAFERKSINPNDSTRSATERPDGPGDSNRYEILIGKGWMDP